MGQESRKRGDDKGGGRNEAAAGGRRTASDGRDRSSGGHTERMRNENNEGSLSLASTISCFDRGPSGRALQKFL